MSVVKTELDQVEGQSLHFLTYLETVLKYLLVLVGFLEIQRVKPFRNPVFITKSLLTGQDREGSPGTNFNYK